MIIIFDTDKIKQFVFGTNKLKEIRGASSILDRLNREDTCKCIKTIFANASSSGSFKKVYANGGQGVFLVPDDIAERCISEVKQLYKKETKIASITGICYPENGNEYNAKAIGELLRKEKESRSGESDAELTSDIISFPFMKFCDSCGVQYVSEEYDKEWLCEVCILKRKKSQKQDSIIQQGLEKRIGLELQFAQDFEEVKDENNYIGIIYADGDGMGEELENINNLLGLEQFSKSIDDGVYQATALSIKKYLLPSNGSDGKKNKKFDVLMLGGDDIVMAVPGDKAIQVATYVLEKFYELTGKSISAGVVIAHFNFPFQQILKYAESLLKIAKKKRSQMKTTRGSGWESGMLSFLTLTSDIPSNVEDYFSKIMVRTTTNGKKYRFHWSAYTVTQMKKIIDFIQVLKRANFPGTKLSMLKRSILPGGLNSTIEFLDFMIHLKEDVKKKFYDFINDTNSTFGKTEFPPWIGINNNVFSTPLFDIASLYRFISEGREER